MYVVDKAAAAAVVPVASLTMGMAAQRLGGAAAADSAHSSERPRDPNKKYLEFTVPREAAGAIIGKGGSILRDMQQEVGAQIYIDRDDPSSSTRRVVVKADDEPTLTKAHERVMSIVNAQAGNANAPPTAGVTSKSGAPGAAPDGEDLDTEPLDPFGL
jgi:polyribonucleotide nucleotidyltransferase